MEETIEEYLKKIELRGKIIDFFADNKIICREIEPNYYVLGWQQKITLATIVIIPKKTQFRYLISLNGIPLNHVGNLRAAKKLTGLEASLTQAQKLLKLLKSMKEVRSDFAKGEGIKNPAHEISRLRRRGHDISIVDLVRLDGDKRKVSKSYIYISGPKTVIT